ncbi:RHOMBOID-RELATED, putative [Babesia bigemina]|uniref:Rhomboid-like protease n=1 Tax=Babesia bigemina TaxID=5866 RepID=A0A061DAV6_BABBI|nr:RHOMBOID-RELATED, putative [Babesia bigemina]CDR97127.1 RHOMBOID-RELATED, putative [Babesia bigemina]|eukprot:XP_012769313.1 RHOMBOID-RELATED, putative [Babesia bigemina]
MADSQTWDTEQRRQQAAIRTRMGWSNCMPNCVEALYTRLDNIAKSVRHCIRKEPSGDPKTGSFAILKSSLVIYIVVFLFSLVINKTTFHGRCIGRVDYSLTDINAPYYSPLGYSACEHNTNSAADSISFYSNGEDNGYPSIGALELNASFSAYYGPKWRTLNILGCADTNYIRHYGEWFRMFTAIALHGGWLHLLNNSVAQVIIFYVIEPEWGFLRTLVGYLVTGYGGYLVGVVFVPCLKQVGSSGIQLGFIGAIVPYCVEHWYAMGSPELILFLSLTIFVVDFAAMDKTVSAHIHVGGYIFGLLYGFATIKSVALFDRGVPYQRFVIRYFSRWMSDAKKAQYIRAIAKSSQSEALARFQYESEAKANERHWGCIKHIMGIYPFGPHRMRRRDIITRVTALTIMAFMALFLFLGLYDESTYTSVITNMTGIFSSACTCCYIKRDATNAYQALQVEFLKGRYFCFSSIEYAERYCVEL